MNEIMNERDGSIFIVHIRKELKKGIAKIIVFDIIALLGYLLITFWVPWLFTQNTKAAEIVYYAVSFAADVFIVYLLIKKHCKKCALFAEIFYGMDSDEFGRICMQAEESGFMFKTFYLLDDYIFIPSKLALIAYTDIKDINTTYHVTRLQYIIPIYDGAEVKIIYQSGKVCKVTMNKIHDFKANYDNFLSELNEKRRNSFARKNRHNAYN